jgi:hypothetical protein
MHVVSTREVAGPVTADERQKIIDLYRAGTKVVDICAICGPLKSDGNQVQGSKADNASW